jgi:hypothetical protein
LSSQNESELLVTMRLENLSDEQKRIVRVTQFLGWFMILIFHSLTMLNLHKPRMFKVNPSIFDCYTMGIALQSLKLWGFELKSSHTAGSGFLIRKDVK